MKFKIKLEQKDYNALLKHLSSKSSSTPSQKIWIFFFIALFLGIFLYSKFQLKQFESQNPGIDLSIPNFMIMLPAYLSMVLPVLILIYLFINRKKVTEKNPSLLKEIEYELTNDLLIIESRFTRTENKWAMYHSVDFTPSHLFLFQDELLASVIPRHQIDSTIEEFIVDKVEQSK